MLTEKLQQKVADYQTQHLLRKRSVIHHKDNNKILLNDKQCINFCSNDYLGIAASESVKQAAIAGIERYGVGSSSSAVVAGYFSVQQELEEQFAEFLQRDRAIYFNSGYVANLGILPALLKRNGKVISDKLSHASLIDGINLARAKHYRFRHQDLEHLETILQHQDDAALVVTESVFSMTGDITAADKLANLTQKYQATLMIDDAHGLGILGETGRGVAEHFQLSQQQLPCLMSPLSKALGGVGAIVSGPHDFIEALLQLSRSYFYTTAMPPVMACAMLAALQVLQIETWRRNKLQYLIHYFVTQAKARDLPLMADDITPLKAFIVHDNGRVRKIQQALLNEGFYVAAIRPPTVPDLTARILISLNCYHAEEEIDRLLDCLESTMPTHK